ncbi:MULTISPECIES: molybdopterin synthase [Halorussus]|uniref:molybdopterin synthase n=1 Tax=Halorussus TaxID=1070314 RepID=UPI000E21811B|nr:MULTISPECIES: molybdopterin synthase [Halorussus]NHN60238.1 molybdopterin synthase [Halorussus sp. JP-T4]
MHVLSVVGPDAAARAVADRLAKRFGEDGRVAEVHRTDADFEQHGGPAAAQFEFTQEGWSATGRNRSLSDLLDDLAPDHDYALLVGFPEADVPRVVVGDDAVDADDEAVAGSDDADAEGDSSGETLVAVESPADADPAEIRRLLDDTEPYETLESLVARVKRSDDAPYAGAIATFTGRVRAKEDPEDDPTEFLEFEKYEGVAEDRLSAIESELEERDGVHEVAMHHRTGVIEYGEDIVFVVVLAGHREEAFRTVEDGINRLKDEVPIFKKEVTTGEQFWVHERQ